MKKPPSESANDLDFETVLNREIGQFGKYQMVYLLMLAIPAMANPLMVGDYIFTAARLPHRCRISECDGAQPEYSPEWILNAIPGTTSGFDDCNRFTNLTHLEAGQVNNAEEFCPATLFDRNNIVPCESYVYARTNSAVYDFNLACQEWLRALPGTLNSVGAMASLVIAGYISDKYGRRVSIVFFSFNLSLIGCIRAFSVNYPMYVSLQFLQTALGGGAFSACYILGTEIVGPRYRVMTGAAISTMFSLGQILLGSVASIIADWRLLSLVLYIPTFLIVSYYWTLTESHRWLLSKHKQDEAKATLEKAARMNGKEISEKSMNFLLSAIPKDTEIEKEINGESLFMRVIKSPVLLRRCCTTPFLWITSTFIYYGLSINSVSLSGNMYVNYIAVSAVEIPGFWTALLLLDRIGRKLSLFIGYMVCAACSFAFIFTPNDMQGLSLLFYLLGKYSIGLVMTAMYIFTVELYPTRYKHSFFGFSSMLGRIGSIIAPLTPPLMVYWYGIPSLMFAAMAVISAILVLTQPETRGLKAPNTFEDAERLGKHDHLLT